MAPAIYSLIQNYHFKNDEGFSPIKCLNHCEAQGKIVNELVSNYINFGKAYQCICKNKPKVVEMIYW